MSRMASSSRKLDRGVGFSSGWAELTLKKPPPLVPSCLMAIWDAAGPTAMVCRVALSGHLLLHDRLALGVQHWLAVRTVLRLLILIGLDQLGLGIRREGLHHALADQSQGQDQGQGQQHVEGGAQHVHPEVAHAARLLAREAAHQGHDHGHAGSGGKEVLHVETQHLGQVTHGGLAAVALPVGVGGEADGGVEGRIRRGVGQPLQVQRQPDLEALQGVNRQETQQVEGQHGEGIAGPGHVVARLDAAQTVEAVLHGFQPADESGGSSR
jgi:hypothetical protein